MSAAAAKKSKASGNEVAKKKKNSGNRVDHPISAPSLKRMANLAGATSVKTDVLTDARSCMSLFTENFLAYTLMHTQSRGANTVQSGDVECAARVMGIPRLYGSHIDSKRTFGSSFGKKKKQPVATNEDAPIKQKKRAAAEEEEPRKKKAVKAKKVAAGSD